MTVVGECHAKPLARLPEYGTQCNQHCGTETVWLARLVTLELLHQELQNVADIFKDYTKKIYVHISMFLHVHVYKIYSHNRSFLCANSKLAIHNQFPAYGTYNV